jgi:hypothetical protein
MLCGDDRPDPAQPNHRRGYQCITSCCCCIDLDRGFVALPSGEWVISEGGLDGQAQVRTLTLFDPLPRADG